MNREEADLTAALRAVPGVEDAELADDTAEGVRVRLSPEADPSDVAAAVRDVLAHYGLRGRMAPPQARIEPTGPPPPPPERGASRPGPRLVQTTILPEPVEPVEPVERDDLSDDAAPTAREEAPIAQALEGPPSEAEPTLESFIRQAPTVAAPAVESAPVVDRGEVTSDERQAATRVLLTRVRVQEDREGVAVTIDTDDGRSVTRRGRPSDAGVREAVVAAVGELSGDQPPPVLMAVEEHGLADHRLVTVLLQRHDGSYHVGSALIGAEKAFALARAAWAAMSQIG